MVNIRAETVRPSSARPWLEGELVNAIGSRADSNQRASWSTREVTSDRLVVVATWELCR